MSKLGSKNSKLNTHLRQIDEQYNSGELLLGGSLLGQELTQQEKRIRNKEIIRQHKLKKKKSGYEEENIKDGINLQERTQLKTSIISANAKLPFKEDGM